MAPTPLQQRRTHNTLLFQKLLNLRDGASPFTLVLDTLEQSGGVVLKELTRRAKISKSKIIYISYTTLRSKVPFEVDVFISGRSKSLSALRSEILSHLPTPSAASSSQNTKYLLIIQSLNTLASTHPNHLTPFLTSLLISPHISLIGTYHTDVPIPSSFLSHPYSPDPLTTLSHLSTAILTVSSLPHVLSAKRARDKSLQEPVFGLSERREGILFGLSRSSSSQEVTQRGSKFTTGDDERGIVVRMELRRKSGRGVIETFVLIPSLPSESKTPTSSLAQILLLDEHPAYATPEMSSGAEGGDGQGGDREVEVEGTFNLGLTEKQRRDRDGVVLPYFDAQKGGGEGGRILYEMSEVDREDFDEEEDEI